MAANGAQCSAPPLGPNALYRVQGRTTSKPYLLVMLVDSPVARRPSSDVDELVAQRRHTVVANGDVDPDGLVADDLEIAEEDAVHVPAVREAYAVLYHHLNDPLRTEPVGQEHGVNVGVGLFHPVLIRQDVHAVGDPHGAHVHPH